MLTRKRSVVETYDVQEIRRDDTPCCAVSNTIRLHATASTGSQHAVPPPSCLSTRSNEQRCATRRGAARSPDRPGWTERNEGRVCAECGADRALHVARREIEQGGRETRRIQRPGGERGRSDGASVAVDALVASANALGAPPSGRRQIGSAHLRREVGRSASGSAHRGVGGSARGPAAGKGRLRILRVSHSPCEASRPCRWGRRTRTRDDPRTKSLPVSLSPGDPLEGGEPRAGERRQLTSSRSRGAGDVATLLGARPLIRRFARRQARPSSRSRGAGDVATLLGARRLIRRFARCQARD